MCIRDSMELQLIDQEDGMVSIELINTLGQTIKVHTESISYGKMLADIAVDELAEGIYHVVISHRSAKYTNVFTVVR